MDEHLNNNRQNEILWRLLADPAEDGRSYALELGRLVADFPQSGLLQALLANTTSAQNVGHAAAYLNPKTLYVLKNAPETLMAVTRSQIIQDSSQSGSNATDVQDTETFSFIEDAVIIESTVNVPEIVKASDAEDEIEGQTVHNHVGEQLTETPTFELADQPHSIDEEVYDEIVGIEDIQIDAVAPHEEETPLTREEELPAEATLSVEEPVVKKERPLNMDDEAEKLIVGNIAATDYFVFDRAFTERKQTETTENRVAAVGNKVVEQQVSSETASAGSRHEVSKYDDDTLPYTFMWWLNKTRREHADTYQPFKPDASQAIRQHASEELQQQYYENIFHVSSVEELERGAPTPALEFDPKNKEDRIIKKFIAEEPHISTPSGDKLDTENKAKRSSEDQDVLVTETLARIYTDQMLYHKAINTYKKLMLKYPEKSRYFADQIEQLERKTN